LVSGLIEFGGAFVAEWIRKVTPRAALLSTLAGIAISFIAIDFAIRTFAMPLVAFLPLGIILTTYFSHDKMPLRIPAGVGRARGHGSRVDPLRFGTREHARFCAAGRRSPWHGRLAPPVPVLGIFWQACSTRLAFSSSCR